MEIHERVLAGFGYRSDPATNPENVLARLLREIVVTIAIARKDGEIKRE